MSLMPDIEGLLEADERNVREMQALFAGYQELSELLNEASVLYTACTNAFVQTVGHEISNIPSKDPRRKQRGF